MSNKESLKEEKKPIVIKNATDLQRLKLEKLMKNPVSIVKKPQNISKRYFDLKFTTQL